MRRLGLVAAVGLAALIAGPARPADDKAKEKYLEFVGQIDAVSQVVIRPRVGGELTKLVAHEGGLVKQGDAIAEIDPRVYKAQLDQGQAQVAVATAQLQLAKVNYERARAAAAKGVSSQTEADQYKAEVEIAEARLVAARATLDTARFSLEAATVRSPIAGRLGRFFLTPGNLAAQDQTPLTTVTGLDPVGVYFEIDEATVLKLRRAGLVGDKPGPRVEVGLRDEKDYPRKGVVDFTDTRIDPKTGALAMRAKLPNPDGLLLPGMSARVRLALPADAK